MDSSNQQSISEMDYTNQQETSVMDITNQHEPSELDFTDRQEAPNVDFTDQQEASGIPKMSHADEKRRAEFEFDDETRFWVDCPLTCDCPECPIRTPHKKGRYLHNDEWAGRHDYFGTCNPPQEIVEAYWRVRNGAYESCSKDYDVVVAFHEIHCRSGLFRNQWTGELEELYI